MQTSLPVSFFSTGGQQRIFVRTLFSDKSFCSKIFSLLFAELKAQSKHVFLSVRKQLRELFHPSSSNIVGDHVGLRFSAFSCDISGLALACRIN